MRNDCDTHANIPSCELLNRQRKIPVCVKEKDFLSTKTHNKMKGMDKEHITT